MNSLGWVLFLVLLGLIALTLFKLRGGTEPGDGPWPLYAKKPMTVPEQVLYFRLIKALPDHIVLAQVGLSRIVGVKAKQNFHAWNNRINRLSADFVVCAKDAKVLAVIELDDASHRTPERLRTDAKKNMALESAGLRIIRWQAKSLPDEATIRTELYTPPVAVGKTPLPPAVTVTQPAVKRNAPLQLDTRPSTF